uniref:PAN-3 domain-containing protein n=1 Tax=Panagrolaimus davidi TaxID=227884 RepID=A0A914P5D8_9BILA
MRAFNIFAFLFLAVLISNSHGGVNIFLNISCVEFNATLSTPIYETPKAAMRECVEQDSCIGFKKTSEYGYQTLRGLTGYVINEASEDNYLWDQTGGEIFPNQPNELEYAIFFAIFKNGNECPLRFAVDGTLCRGNTAISKDICDTFPSYMVPQWDGTTCFVVQKQTILNQWA